MSGHFLNKCEHGTVLGQCRCPGPKTVRLVACPGGSACPVVVCEEGCGAQAVYVVEGKRLCQQCTAWQLRHATVAPEIEMVPSWL